MDHLPNQPLSRETGGASEPAGELVTISRAELDALLARVDAPAPPVADAPPVRPAADRDTGPTVRDALARELTERDRRYADLERVAKNAIRERELATSLAGKSLVSGAAAQLIKLWRDEFDVYEDEGGYKVAASDGRPVAQVVADLLASPEYSHFSLPTSRGGTGARGASRPVDASATPQGPKNLGEAIVMKWREESASRADSPSKPIGLRRHR